ncbi:Protein CBG15410 [Caenorhabditis briggsae]|uniref:Protein CBG15410 n=2 Tax=Caenorhabditis briggsae TaxID=6238 RepID=A8XMC2_CAEBR|nr:Protein CBG15410 [Caenorhabditis briggsae]CAP33797.2 Protein CBG15410 [Caenorhabditis briggsae]
MIDDMEDVPLFLTPVTKSEGGDNPAEPGSKELEKFLQRQAPSLKGDEKVGNPLDPFQMIKLFTFGSAKKIILEQSRLQPNSEKELIIVSFSKMEHKVSIISKQFPDTKWSIMIKGQDSVLSNSSFKFDSSLKWNTFTELKLKNDLAKEGTSKNEEKFLQILTLDVITATSKLFDFISEMYGSVDSRLRLMYDLIDNGLDEIINIFVEKSNMVQYEFFSFDEKETLLKPLLRKLNHPKELTVLSQSYPDFQYHIELRNVLLESFISYGASFMKLDEIMNIKSEKICLFEVNLNQFDLGIIINAWMLGWNPQWKALLMMIDNNYLEIESLVEGKCLPMPVSEDWGFLDRNPQFPLIKFEKDEQIGYRRRRDEDGAAITFSIRQYNVFKIILSPAEATNSYTQYDEWFDTTIKRFMSDDD